MMRLRYVAAFLNGAFIVSSLRVLHAEPTGDELVKRQCRSVHLSYQHPAATAAYIEVIPERSAVGTYFCALGFRMGYFGIQELVDGSHIALFSVWDAQDQEKLSAGSSANERVSLIEKGEAVTVRRFGGEGTGEQSLLSVDWKMGEAVAFLLQARATTQHTRFTAHLYQPAQQRWLLMATFETVAKNLEIQGLYSFIEDFQRDGVSAQRARRARFIHGGIRVDDQWQALSLARFTADVTPSVYIDAGMVDQGFYLMTGGETRQLNTKLGQLLRRGEEFRPPARLPLVAD